MKPAQNNAPYIAHPGGSDAAAGASSMTKERIVKDDGRYLIFYRFGCRFGKRSGDRAAEGADKAGLKEGRA